MRTEGLAGRVDRPRIGGAAPCPDTEHIAEMYLLPHVRAYPTSAAASVKMNKIEAPATYCTQAAPRAPCTSPRRPARGVSEPTPLRCGGVTQAGVRVCTSSSVEEVSNG